MEMKRVLQGTAVAALAAAAWIGAGSTDASAEVKVDKITPADNGTALSVEFDSTELMVGFGKVKESRGVKGVKISNWDVYDGGAQGQAKIDLSKLKAQQDNCIVLTTNDMEAPIALNLTAVKSKYKGAIDAVKKEIYFENDKQPVTEYEIETASGWENATVAGVSEIIAGLQHQGGTIYVRETSKVKLGAKDEGKLNITVPEQKTPIASDSYSLGSLPGKEVKLNVTKQASGPSVKAEYAKGTVKCSKTGIEYRVIDIVSGGAVTGGAVTEKSAKTSSVASADTIEIKDADFKNGVAVDTILGNTAEGWLEVRIKATGTETGLNVKRNRCASKWRRVKIAKIKDITVAKVASGPAVTLITDTENKTLTAATAVDTRQKVNLTLQNNTDTIYEYYVSATAPTTTTKGTALKNSTPKIIKNTAGKHLYIRIAADARNNIWVGNWADAGVIPAPETAE